MYSFKDYEVIAGAYKPLSISTTFVGLGGHLRFKSETFEEKRIFKLTPAFTVIPSVTYANSLNDGVYGTLGLRLTYAPVLYTNIKEEEEEAQKQFIPEHKFEGGLHIDFHIERTLGMGLNGYTNYYLYPEKSVLTEEENWGIEGNFSLGATYWLER